MKPIAQLECKDACFLCNVAEKASKFITDGAMLLRKESLKGDWEIALKLRRGKVGKFDSKNPIKDEMILKLVQGFVKSELLSAEIKGYFEKGEVSENAPIAVVIDENGDTTGYDADRVRAMSVILTFDQVRVIKGKNVLLYFKKTTLVGALTGGAYDADAKEALKALITPVEIKAPPVPQECKETVILKDVPKVRDAECRAATPVVAPDVQESQKRCPIIPITSAMSFGQAADRLRAARERLAASMS